MVGEEESTLMGSGEGKKRCRGRRPEDRGGRGTNVMSGAVGGGETVCGRVVANCLGV